MLNDIFSKSASPRKRIAVSELVDVLHHACDLSYVTRSTTSSSYDFERSRPCLTEHDLHEHVTFVSRNFTQLPLNSERHVYDLRNIVLSNLHLTLDHRSAWTAHDDWTPLSYAKWHFDNCLFDASSANMWTLHFPWPGSFRFHNNAYNFPSDRYPRHWLFVFSHGSRVLLHGNDFRGHTLQTQCVPATLDPSTPHGTGNESTNFGSISFVGNKGISSLDILEGFSSISVIGMNHIERLWIQGVSQPRRLHDTMSTRGPVVYFGSREKIDRRFHYSLEHRKLFLNLRMLAAIKHDARQVSVFDREIDRIEYYLNKDKSLPKPSDYSVWTEYWRDRLFYAWKRWSSDFYRSWSRPLFMAIVGYLLLNAVPGLLIDSFTISDWIAFCLRPLGEIPQYERSLSALVGSDYELLPTLVRNLFKLVGFFEVAWIAMWSFAFAQSVRK